MTNESQSTRSFFAEIDQMFTEGKGASMQNTAFSDRTDRSPSADFGALLDQIFGGNPPKMDAAPSNDMADAEDIQNAVAFIDLMSALLGVPPVAPAAAPFAMVPFAKLFNTRYGQLLVTLNNPTPEHEGPHIVIRGAGPREYTPEFVMAYSNTDDGWLSAARAFDAFSQEVAEGAAADLSARGQEAFSEQLMAAMAASAEAGMTDATKHRDAA
jgi:hypothetical protein